LEKKLVGLLGDTLVSAASVAYLGPFIRSFRHRLTAEWLTSCTEAGVGTSQNYDMIRLMTDSNQVGERVLSDLNDRIVLHAFLSI